MEKIENKNTRYFLDVNLSSGKIVSWDYDDKDILVKSKPSDPVIHRIFLTKGQFNKFVEKQSAISH